MCRISFITIHENVWLDSSLWNCHLLCLVLSFSGNCRERWTELNAKPIHPSIQRAMLYTLGIYVIFGIVPFVALLRFSDMRSDILWFFWFLACVHSSVNVTNKQIKGKKTKRDRDWDGKRQQPLAHTQNRRKWNDTPNRYHLMNKWMATQHTHTHTKISFCRIH